MENKKLQSLTERIWDSKKENNRIVTDSNVDWYKPVFDVSLGSPALIATMM